MILEYVFLDIISRCYELLVLFLRGYVLAHERLDHVL